MGACHGLAQDRRLADASVTADEEYASARAGATEKLVDLGIVRDGDKYTITIVQSGPVPYSDAMGEDRVLVLTFADDVLARDVNVEVLDRTVD